jgi:hypothetical protein
MTPQDFIAKWRLVNVTERSACQQHFLDLCDLLVQPRYFPARRFKYGRRDTAPRQRDTCVASRRRTHHALGGCDSEKRHDFPVTANLQSPESW